MKENKFTGWGKKEEALYFAGYPRSEEYYKGDMEFEEFLGLKAKLVGPKDFWAAEEHLGKVDSVTGWKPHFTVSQLKKLVFEPVED